MRSLRKWMPFGAAVLLALACATPYATLNQATYLLDPMRRAMPALFHRDWFVAETPPYLPVFGWVFHWLYVIDPEGPIAFVTAHLVSMAATYAAIYWLVMTIDAGWKSFLLLAAFIAISMDLSMGGSYLVTGYFQPSSVSTRCWIIALAALARDRVLLAGHAAAVAGLCHANFLVLGVGLFGLTALLRRDLSWRQISLVLGPQLVVLVFFLPQLLSAAGPSKHAIWILTHFHAPVHYASEHLVGWIKDLFAWQIGAFAALRLLDRSRPVRTLWWFSLVVFVVVTLTALLISFPPFEALTQVRWSRMAPFGQLACQVLMVGGLARQARDPRPLTRSKRLLVGLGMLIAVVVPSYHLRGIVPYPAWAFAWVAIIVVLAAPQRIVANAMTLVALLAVAGALWRSPHAIGLRTSSVASEPERELEHWVRSETPADALFLAPPDFARFRLLARRAVVVDAKSPPLQPDLLEKWQQRMCAMVLATDLPTYQAVADRYAQLTPEQLQQVARAFGADYIVVRTGVPFADPPLFTNDLYSVYRVKGGPD